MPLKAPAQVRACATPWQHPLLYGSRKLQDPLHIRATRRGDCQSLL